MKDVKCSEKVKANKVTMSTHASQLSTHVVYPHDVSLVILCNRLTMSLKIGVNFTLPRGAAKPES